LESRPFLWLLFVFNLLGSIYGFYWYGRQMEATPWYWNIFVPDSPTSSTFFTLVVLIWLLGKSSPLLEMISMVTNIKYGIWACSVIVTYWVADREVYAEDVMLMLSHGAMAIEVILYNYKYRFSWNVLWIGAIWLLYNDFVDYVFHQHPWLQDDRFTTQIGFWTAILSIATLAFVAVMRPREALPLACSK
jgi:uncharacterized membrane protein YpjA